MSDEISMPQRLVTVIVVSAALSLALGLADAFNADFGLFELWIDSWFFKLIALAVLWFIAPWVYRKIGVKGIYRKSDDE
jgi:hypothetical protein